MKSKKVFSGFIAVIITVMFCLCSFSAEISALVNTTGSITIHVSDFMEGQPLSGMTFRLYYFAMAYEDGDGLRYEYTSDYKECGMDIEDVEDSYFPIHLSEFAQSNSLSFKEGTTDESGNAVYENLGTGLYLAVPAGSLNDYFVPSPFVIYVPRFNQDNMNWIHDVVAYPKMLAYKWIDTDGDTYISVKKVWQTGERIPESVTVSLLCDYKETERVTLNESNNWSYRWDKLSKKHAWSVVETEVPDGYTVSYEISEKTVTIINRHEHWDPQNTTTPEDDPDDELIYTGQLNWPIPIFAIVGLLLFSIGWAMFNFGNKDEETA